MTGDYGDVFVERDGGWQYLNSISDATNFIDMICWPMTGQYNGVTSSWYGWENAIAPYGTPYDATKAWRPLKIRAEWTASSTVKGIFAWNDYFIDILPSDGSYTSPIELTFEWVGPIYEAYNGQLENLSIEQVSGTSLTDRSTITLTKFQAYGLNPYLYLNPDIVAQYNLL